MRSADIGQRSVKNILGGGFENAGLLTLPEELPIIGPRSWWHGPLNVEQLALGSTALVSAAVEAISGGEVRVDVQADQVAAAFASMNHLRIDGKKPQGFAEHSGFYRTADGWIRTHANYPHHERRLLQAAGAHGGITLTEALRQLGASEAQELINAAGGVAAQVQSRTQWVDSVAGRHAQNGQWAQFSHHAGPGRKCWTFDPRSRLPLAGLRVLDLTRVIAGPTATRTLAAFGAQVLRVDAPQLPELSEQFIDTGFGKRSTLLDLSVTADHSRMDQLLEDADVLILGYRQGALSTFGFDVQRLRAQYPNLIVAELDAWGYGGPWVNRRGFDSIVQAACGIADTCKDEFGVPGALPVQALDHATGYGLAAAIIAMVHARSERRSIGHVRFSLARTAEALFAFDSPSCPERNLDAPLIGSMASSFGRLQYVLPPFIVNGSALDYRTPPPAYGMDQPRWL